MSEFLLDQKLVDRLVADMEYELDRKAPPENFPKFPDIPSARYTNEDFYDLEQKYLWNNSWLAAGRVEDIPDSGNYFLFEETGIPLIVVRGNDNKIRCFSNTCRHRGAPVVREKEGTIRHLQCQYHSWTYGIDNGELLAVPDERDFVDLCKEDRGLPEISCDTWGGWIWINVNPDASPLIDFLGKIPEEMEQYQCENLRLVGTDHREVNCNWKVAIEAFQEVYHFRFIHDRGGWTSLDSRGGTMGLLKHGNSRMVVPRSKQMVEKLEMESWKDFKIVKDPLGLENISTVHPIVHCTSYSFTIFPNFITPLAATGFPVMLFFPAGIDKTRIRIYHYAPDWGDGDPPGAWEQRIAEFGGVIDEDVWNLDAMQKAMESPTYDGTPLCYQERRIYNMQEVIDRVIGVERIPEDMTVAQLLDKFIEE